MPALDIFQNDAFGVVSLTKAINDIPYQPKRLGELGWFSEEGVTTTALMLEREGTTISLIPAGSRGAPGRPEKADKRKLVSLPSVHLPQRATINADEVQNVRAFGSETDEMTVTSLVNKRLVKLRRNIDTTIEWQRMGAVKGQVLDSDGSVLLDLFQTFGLTKTTKALALNVDATKVRTAVVGAKRTMEQKLGGLEYRSIRVLCSASFFDAFVDHPAVQRAWDNFQDRALLQQDLRGPGANGGAGGGGGAPAGGFMFAGCYWEEYRGNISGQSFIADGKAHMVPEGVPDLFSTTYSPADYMETVNTIGLPYYAKQELMDFNKGVEIEAQSNPITYCTRPDALIELSIS
ncbi:major capsid protein [Cupriavidus sp. CV2]|uniref:major capsid protein n=1 Tax=Cupriavidus ulmosensis TaxID=3065913 RepID=UPI00296AED1B|nr:major capsid protein [Cupriavidus sp. CV2]MDW3682938.1 major capsid protein [Cupriavidus sp. CV2]